MMTIPKFLDLFLLLDEVSSEDVCMGCGFFVFGARGGGGVGLDK